MFETFYVLVETFNTTESSVESRIQADYYRLSGANNSITNINWFRVICNIFTNFSQVFRIFFKTFP